MFRSLRIKFTFSVLILLFLVFSVSSGILILRSINTQTNNLIAQSRAFAKLTTKPIGDTYTLYYESGYLKFAELMNQILVLGSSIEKVQIISVTGEILFDSDQLITNAKPSKDAQESDPQVLDKVREITASETPPKEANSRPQQIIEPYFEDFGAHPFSIRYFISYEAISENLSVIITTTLLLSLVFFATTIILIFSVVNRSIINPLEVVIAGAEKIRKGELSHKIYINTRDEIEDLAAAVNQMAETLKRNIEDLRELDKLKDEFVFLASHNLRTPLTVIKGYVLNLQKNKNIDPKMKKEIERISQASEELSKITESLINLVSLEKDKKPLQISEVDLTKLVETVSEKFSQVASEKRISFVFEFPSKPLPKIKLDEQRITQALSSLIDNAVKFNKEGGKVIIKIEKRENELLISISDTGIGISKVESARVFQKFHRATDVLTYNYEGVGLGLYLTKLIVQAHLGKIWFESVPQKGTTFYITLPIREEYQEG